MSLRREIGVGRFHALEIDPFDVHGFAHDDRGAGAVRRLRPAAAEPYPTPMRLIPIIRW